ncbi:hypothetical protein ACE38W_02360 [Chitinophaga sp. Hz27]|uniref:hypothetical protein n=1 Tax=Chitinophaga sp. Hz27 TaxID=3347169 RepID=UPI0035DE27BA
MKNIYLTFCIIFFSCTKSKMPNNFVKVNDARAAFQKYLSDGYSLASFPIIHTSPDWNASQMYVSDTKTALIVPYTETKVEVTYRPDSSMALGLPAIAFYYNEGHQLKMEPFLLIQRNDKHAAGIVAYTDNNTVPRLLKNDLSGNANLVEDMICTQTDWYTRVHLNNISFGYAYNYTTLQCLTVFINGKGAGIPTGGIFSGILNMALGIHSDLEKVVNPNGYSI